MRVLKRGGAGLTLLAGVGLIGAGLVGAQTGGSSRLFELSASASGVHVIVAMPDFVVVDRFLDGGGPTAQASLTSLDGPASYAAQPYPGEIAIAFPGLLKVVGFPADIPPYPFYVNASATKPEERLSQPGYELSATAAPAEAASSARSGHNGDPGVIGRARSTARAWVDGATYRSEAVSTADVLQVGPLRLAGLESKATASTPTAGGATTLGSGLEVAAASVNGVPVAFTPDGVTLAGSTVPLPEDDPLARALDQAGVSVEYLTASRSENTVVSPGLRIRAVQTFPGVDRALQVTYLIGQTVAHAAVRTVAGESVPPVQDPPLSTGPAPTPALPDDQVGGRSGPSPAGAVAAGPGAGSVTPGTTRSSSGGAPLTMPGGGGAPPANDEAETGDEAAVSPPPGGAEPAGGGAALDSSLALAEATLPTTSSESVYLVLAGSALLAALALHGLRQLGVRAPARIGG